MTKNEVREMYGLPPLEEEIKPIVSSAIHRFDDHVCEHSFASQSEIDELRKSKREITEYAKQKLKELKEKQDREND